MIKFKEYKEKNERDLYMHNTLLTRKRLIAIALLFLLAPFMGIWASKPTDDNNDPVQPTENAASVLSGSTSSWNQIGAQPSSFNAGSCTQIVSAGGNIQTAVNGAEGGATICVQAGNFASQAITISTANLTLRAAGNATVGRMNIMADDVTLNGFDITSSSLGDSQYGIFIDGSDAQVVNNHVYDTTNYGLNCENEEFNNCDGLYLHHNTFERNSSIGVETWGSDVLIEHNIISDPTDDPDCCDTDALRVMAGSNQTVRGNYMYIGPEPGTDTDDHPDCIMMFDSATAYYQGWTINTNVLIEGNICVNDAPGGHNGFILAGRNEHLSEDFIIRNNICDHNGGTCYFISDVDDVEIYNNLCTERSGVCISNDRVNSNMVAKNNIDEPGTLEFIRNPNNNGLVYSHNHEGALSYNAAGSPNYVGQYFYTIGNSLKNTGDNSVASGSKDVNFKTRVVGSAVDIGPFEQQASTPSNPSPDSNPGSNNDSVSPEKTDDNSKITEQKKDGNGDGITDDKQDNVATVHNPVTNTSTTLQLTGQCTVIDTFYITDESQLAVADDRFTYPVGLSDFEISCDEAGQSTEVSILYDQLYSSEDWLFRKFDPLSDNFVDISSDVTIEAKVINDIDVTSVTYTIVDGGPLDADGEANGRISDPAGPALLSTTDTGADASSSDTNPSHSSKWKVIGIMIALLGAGGGTGYGTWWYIRKRRQTKNSATNSLNVITPQQPSDHQHTPYDPTAKHTTDDGSEHRNSI